MTRRSLTTALTIVALVLPALLAAQTQSEDREFLETNGVELAYRVIGTGEPLLMLHGFSGTGATWDPIVDAMAERYMLVIPELRGHGRSSNPTGIFTHREAALDVFGLLDQLTIEQVRAIGFSTGGMTLLHMATSQPDRVEAMALVGATSYYTERAREIMRTMDPDGIPEAQLESMGNSHGGGIEQARALMSQFHAFKDDYEDMNFTPPLLSTITARTLIIHGDRDAFFPVAIPVEQYQAIPDSYLMVLPNSGHTALPSDPEGREFFVATLHRFLDGDWRCPSACGR